jgi:hypothetical protein
VASGNTPERAFKGSWQQTARLKWSGGDTWTFETRTADPEMNFDLQGQSGPFRLVADLLDSKGNVIDGASDKLDFAVDGTLPNISDPKLGEPTILEPGKQLDLTARAEDPESGLKAIYVFLSKTDKKGALKAEDARPQKGDTPINKWTFDDSSEPTYVQQSLPIQVKNDNSTEQPQEVWLVVTAINLADQANCRQCLLTFKPKERPPTTTAAAPTKAPGPPPKYGSLTVKLVKAGDYKVKITPALPGQEELSGSILLDKAKTFDKVLVTKQPYVVEWEYVLFDPKDPKTGKDSVTIEENKVQEITIPH